MNKIEQDDKTYGEEYRLPCIECAKKTRHIVRKSIDIKGKEEGRDFILDWETHFQIIECLGCETISFRKSHSNSEDMVQIGDDEWEVAVHQQLFPARIEGRKGIIKEEWLLPSNVRRIYNETNQALVGDSQVLTGIGIRAIVESVCKEKSAEGRNLLAKIDNLVDKQVLTPAGAEILHNLRVMGNNSAHEVKPHTDEQLALAMDVIDHLLMDVYILSKKVKSAFNDDQP